MLPFVSSDAKVLEAVEDKAVADELELKAVVVVVQNTAGFLLEDEDKVDRANGWVEKTVVVDKVELETVVSEVQNSTVFLLDEDAAADSAGVAKLVEELKLVEVELIAQNITGLFVVLDSVEVEEVVGLLVLAEGEEERVAQNKTGF